MHITEFSGFAEHVKVQNWAMKGDTVHFVDSYFIQDSKVQMVVVHLQYIKVPVIIKINVY